MGQYYKTKEFDVNVKFHDYFYLNDLKNYEMIYIINDKDYYNFINNLNLNDITILSKEGIINDENPIYLILKTLSNSKIIYLKENLNILIDDNIKSFISNFKGIIICNIKLINYLNDLNLVHDEFYLKEKTYLKIDKFGLKEEIEL